MLFEIGSKSIICSHCSLARKKIQTTEHQTEANPRLEPSRGIPRSKCQIDTPVSRAKTASASDWLKVSRESNRRKE
jgi:hypothetical protein